MGIIKTEKGAQQCDHPYRPKLVYPKSHKEKNGNKSLDNCENSKKKQTILLDIYKKSKCWRARMPSITQTKQGCVACGLSTKYYQI